MNALYRDLRFAVRGLCRSPGFTAVALLTLALGIGATSAIFSVVDGVLLRPLPYADPDRIVTALHGGRSPVAPANYLDWRAQSRAYDSTAAAQAWGPQREATLYGRGRPEALRGLRVTADLFQVLGVAPLHGRTFAPGEDQPGAPATVVLSHRLWQRRFAGDPAIVGQTLVLDGTAHTVVGVMPPGFAFPLFWLRNADLWAPLDLSARAQDRSGESLRLFARLRPGVTRAQAQAETSAIWQRLAARHPRDTRADVVIGSLHEKVVGNVQRPLLVLLAGVGFVLLIGCANVANLLLARSAARRREIAIRASLGAGRGRLLRQLLTESALLALLGGGLGAGLAAWGVQALVALGPRDLPRLDGITVDGPVLLFTLAVSLLTGVVFGLAPAFQLTALDVQGTLRAGGRAATAGGRSGDGMRGLLVVAEVALALVLLNGGGLMIRSFQRLGAIDPGFAPARVVAFEVPARQARPPATPDGMDERDARAEARRRLFQQLMARVRALPGVEAASAINHLPLAGDIWGRSYTVVGAPLPPPDRQPTAVYRVIAPGYLDTMGMTLLRGRDPGAHDGPGAPGVAVVNEALARATWPGQSALGKRISLEDGGPDPREIVGVVANVRQREWAAAAQPEVFLPYLQNPSSTLTLVVRAAADPLALVPAVQREIAALDGELPLARAQVMDEVISDAVGQPRFQLLLLNLFAALALLLAAVGVYGVMAHAVSRRTQEMGIRLALGAPAGRVLGLVVGQGMQLAAAGVALGLVAAFAATRLLRALLYEVSPTDPVTFVALPLVLLAVAALASYPPARRATRIDPMTALRAD
jgi:putative ABC transport system permease protein